MQNKTAKKLCSCRKILEAQDENGWSALTVAVYNNNFEMVDYLISNGADIKILNNNGTNLLMYAKDCYINTGSITIYKYLLDQGLDPELTDYTGMNVYDYCTEEVIKTLKECTIDLSGGGTLCK